MKAYSSFKTPALVLALVLAGFVAQRWFVSGSRKSDTDTSTTAAAETQAGRSREELVEAYPLVPRDEIVGDRELLEELQARYRNQLDALQKQVASSGARMVVVYLTPEFGSHAQRMLEPFIRELSREMGIEYVDLANGLEDLDPLSYTQMPRDGHWSVQGAAVVARMLGDILVSQTDIRSNLSFRDEQRPPLFGDLEPAQDVILDGGKNLPYRLQTNNQGLRLDRNLEFPKSRQRVLLLGDSQFYCPFLDNPDTIAAQLQGMFPDREIVSAANVGYGLDDIEGLFRERARFMEPDLVIVQTGGGDVLDAYFGHRNVFSRTRAAFEPTPVEERFARAIAKEAARP